MKDLFKMENEKLIGTLKCPDCDNILTVEQVLENCTISWPYKDWILLKCPVCSGFSHVEIITDKLSTGVLDGAPGPCFFICSEKSLNDFDVYKTSDFIECKYNGKKYNYKSKK